MADLNLNAVTVRIVDVATEAREMYGDDAEYMAGRPLPAHDYRFEVVGPDGTRITFHAGAALSAEAILAELQTPGGGQ